MWPYRVKFIRRRLEQIIEPLRIRKANLVHRRNRDCILIVFLNGKKIPIEISRDKIELAIFLDGMGNLVYRIAPSLYPASINIR